MKSFPPSQKKPIARSGIKRVNRKRRARNWARAYHSEERVEFVNAMPCCACGVIGYTENAHVPPKGEAGTGYKADAKWIVPLCGLRVERGSGSICLRSLGCHNVLHELGRASFEKSWGIDLTSLAATVQEEWRAWKESQA